jgi:micrococcal nuclease
MHARRHPYLSIAAAVLMSLALPLTSCAQSPPHGATVHEVIDGDTLVIVIDRRREHVRLLGIDTPETKHPTKPVECFGPEAATFLAQLLPAGTPVQVVRDVEARDRFGRLLLHLFVNLAPGQGGATHVNAALVHGGYARLLSIPPNRAFDDVLEGALFAARTARRGLWGACTQ